MAFVCFALTYEYKPGLESLPSGLGAKFSSELAGPSLSTLNVQRL